AFGLVALTIATVGLIVLTSYAVTRRFHELAVRTACGAQPDELVRYILGRVVAPMLTGLAIGVAGAYVGARMLDALLFDAAPADPRVFVGAIAGLLTCAVFGALFPARRAGRVDPVVAL